MCFTGKMWVRPHTDKDSYRLSPWFKLNEAVALSLRHCRDSCLRLVYMWQSLCLPFTTQPPDALSLFLHSQSPDAHLPCFPFPSQLTPSAPACSTCSLPHQQILQMFSVDVSVSCQPAHHVFFQLFVPVACFCPCQLLSLFHQFIKTLSLHRSACLCDHVRRRHETCVVLLL